MQYFLQSKGVPYFFTDYSDYNICLESEKLDPEVSYLYEQIDRSHYLPITSEFQWIVNNNILLDNLPSPEIWQNVLEEKVDGVEYKWNRWVHPTSTHHQIFVDKIVLPFIKLNNLLGV